MQPTRSVQRTGEGTERARPWGTPSPWRGVARVLGFAALFVVALVAFEAALAGDPSAGASRRMTRALVAGGMALAGIAGGAASLALGATAVYAVVRGARSASVRRRAAGALPAPWARHAAIRRNARPLALAAWRVAHHRVVIAKGEREGPSRDGLVASAVLSRRAWSAVIDAVDASAAMEHVEGLYRAASTTGRACDDAYDAHRGGGRQADAVWRAEHGGYRRDG